jgi:hypothetical protein
MIPRSLLRGGSCPPNKIIAAEYKVIEITPAKIMSTSFSGELGINPPIMNTIIIAFEISSSVFAVFSFCGLRKWIAQCVGFFLSCK